MTIVWISGFCAGSGLAGLVLALAGANVQPNIVGALAMLCVSAGALMTARKFG